MIQSKKGFTLIELIIVISIISIVSCYTLVKISFFNSKIDSIDVDKCNNAIMMFINNAKLYCREKETSGTIYFYPGKDKADFNVQCRNVEHLTLPSKFYIYDVNSAYSKINIDSKGFVSDACTISFRDRSDKLHEISIFVGTGFVQIKS